VTEDLKQERLQFPYLVTGNIVVDLEEGKVGPTSLSLGVAFNSGSNSGG